MWRETSIPREMMTQRIERNNRCKKLSKTMILIISLTSIGVACIITAIVLWIRVSLSGSLPAPTQNPIVSQLNAPPNGPHSATETPTRYPTLHPATNPTQHLTETSIEYLQKADPKINRGIRVEFNRWNEINDVIMSLNWYKSEELLTAQTLSGSVDINLLNDDQMKCWNNDLKKDVSPWNRIYCTLSSRKNKKFHDAIHRLMQQNDIIMINYQFPFDINHTLKLDITNMDYLAIDLLFVYEYERNSMTKQKKQFIIYSIPTEKDFKLIDHPIAIQNPFKRYCWLWSLIQSFLSFPQIRSDVKSYYENELDPQLEADPLSSLILSIFSSILNKNAKFNPWQLMRYNLVILSVVTNDQGWNDPDDIYTDKLSDILLFSKYFKFDVNIIKNTKNSDGEMITSRTQREKNCVWTNLPRQKATNFGFPDHVFVIHDLKWNGDTELEQLTTVENANIAKYPDALYIKNHMSMGVGFPLQNSADFQSGKYKVINHLYDFQWGDFTYSLQSKIVHTSHHYYAYVLWEDGNWYQLNDDHWNVEPADKAKQITPTGHFAPGGAPCSSNYDATILMYRKI